MRTTVIPRPDVEQILRQHMCERQVSFKVALNDAIRRGDGVAATPFQTMTASLGES